MATSGVEDAAMRLLEAFYDLSGGKLGEPVSVEAADTRGTGAAPRAGLEPGSTERDVALRYLLNQGYVEGVGADSGYGITVAGIDRVRVLRGLDSPATPEERSGMSEAMQRRLVTVMGMVGSQILVRPLTRFIGEQIPERRGIRDDLAEAIVKGLARTIALALASILVRQLASRR